ncbi:MAG: YceI family protein [Acidobacteria bacterium]|nr:YceI family protein [Acidobacteriota bacterium]
MKVLTLAIILAAPAVHAEPVSYRIDSSHSSVQFSIRHLMVANVRGEFSKVSGSLVWDAVNPEKLSVTAVIDVTTINTREAKRDADLKGPDFFDTAKYPEAKFVSKRVSRSGDDLLVVGDLTMRGAVHEVTLTASVPPAEVKDARGNFKTGTTATGKLSRKKWGIVYNPALETGGVVIGDEVTLTIDIEAVKVVK